MKLLPNIDCLPISDIDLSKYDSVAVPIIKSDSGIELGNPKAIKTIEKHFKIELANLLSNWPDATGKAGELLEVPIAASEAKLSRIYFVGVGENTPEDLRKAGTGLSRKVKNSGSAILNTLVTTKQSARSHAVAISLASYSWSQKSPPPKALKAASFTLVGKFESELIEARLLAEGVWRGSKNWPHIVLVGKGITFDTGGVSLKRPYEHMVGMKSDMSGAAAVLATVIAIAKLGVNAPKVRVTGILMCAENALSSTSQRPSDVITHFGGTTVEVINTDAEGRLVLADGLAYADAELDPDYLIDVATLTGAATLGLGRQYAAMYTRDVALAQSLYNAGQSSGERVWHMPLIDDYKVALASEIADFNHTAEKPDFNGGSITAALFLEHFAGDRKWVHLDIAGPARSENDSGENPKGGTGFGVRLLIEWLTSL